ncbi:MAG: FAD-dependent monooxygenase [Ktedonobacteraceae bacterium]
MVFLLLAFLLSIHLDLYTFTQLKDKIMMVDGTHNQQKALIVGGGLGGLAVALALRQIGMEVEVFEAASELRELGAGLTLWPNAVRSLQEIGIGEDTLQAISKIAYHRTIRTWRGTLLSEIHVDRLAHSQGTGIYVAHRAALQRAMIQALGEDSLHLGARCAGIRQDGESVWAQFEDGSEVQGDLLLGADGIRSVVRTQLFGPQPLHYAGYTSYRGIGAIEQSHVPEGISSETWGVGRRIGLIPIDTNRVYWFAVENAPEGTNNFATPEARKQHVQKLFKGWHEPIEEVISGTPAEKTFSTDIWDIDPLPAWTRGRVALLGDAAHAMTPNMGQGACQSIEDGTVLAHCLQNESNISVALKAYEAIRLPRTRRVTLQSRRIGYLSQFGNELACQVRNVLVKRLYTGALSKEMEWVLTAEG